MSSTTTKSASTASTKTFLTALVANGAVFTLNIVAFTLIRAYFRRIYEPRALRKVVNKLSFFWPLQLFREDYTKILQTNGLDAYFFVRFLRMMMNIMLPIWLVSWAVLLPLTSIKSRVDENSGLELFTFGNVQPDQRVRYVGHLVLVFVFTAWIFYNIRKEMRHFVITRQHHLIDAKHAKTLQANTILVTGIPIKYLNQKSLQKVYGSLPGGVKTIWVNRNLKELPEVYERRLKACNKLEAAETKLLKLITKNQAKTAQSNEKASPRPTIEDKDRPTHKLGFLGLFGEKVDSINWAKEEIRVCNELLDQARVKFQTEIEATAAGVAPEHEPVKGEDQEEDEFATRSQQDDADPNRPDAEAQIQARSDPAIAAPKSRVAALTGQAASQFTQTTKQAAHAAQHAATKATKTTVQAAQNAQNVAKNAVDRVTGGGTAGEYPPLNSAFITFHRQIAAHLAMQSLSHHEPYRMSDRYNEISPQDVVWSNLGLNPYETKVRLAISWGLTIGLIVVWAIPVAFVGSLANIKKVCGEYTWLSWLCLVDGVPLGILQGILPPVLLAVLMMLLPIVLRLMAQFEGIPRKTGIELSLMSRFFVFHVIHSFLIVTLASGLIPAIPGLAGNPASIPNLLATQLPLASNFFLTFVLLQLAGTAGGFLQIVYLIVYYVKLVLLGSTPRSTWSLKYGKRAVTSWGTVWPGVTLVVVIALGYSIISPIINGIAFATFALLFVMHKYMFLWVMDQSDVMDTGGLFFPKAIGQIFVGLYIQQICLCALFFLRKAIPHGALMVVLIAITVFFQMILNNSYGPLLHALPLSLADKMYVAPEVPETHSDASRDPETPVVKKPSPKPVSDDRGFLHPALRFPQRTIWLPRDIYGLGEEEARLAKDEGIDVVCGEGADLTEKAKLEVAEDPGRPGELGEIP